MSGLVCDQPAEERFSGVQDTHVCVQFIIQAVIYFTDRFDAKCVCNVASHCKLPLIFMSFEVM